MSEPKFTLLPTYAEMRRRLIEMDDTSNLVVRFYPIVLRSAGRRMTGEEIVTMLDNAVAQHSSNPLLVRILRMSLKEYMEALVDDERVRADANAAIIERKKSS